MIMSFKDKEAAKLFNLQSSRRLPRPFSDRQGQHSISVNDQYRICFYWKDRHAHQVEIVDYH
jgi:proteic killer suppression protein